jgi:hypothetical protein
MLKTVGFPSTRTGDQTIVGGNLVIGTAGKGIDFSADPSAPGMTSELLNDYEEGTFTPTVYGGTTAGTTNYLSQIGLYTKIGRVVHFMIYVDWNSQSGTGTLNVGDLPFTVKQTFVQTPGAVTSSNLTFTAGASLACAIQPGATNITVAESTTAIGQNYVAVDGVATLFIAGSYMV